MTHASQMQIDLETQAVQRGGVFTRAEAIATGMTDNDIARNVRRGDWHRVRKGCFVTSAAWAAADDIGRLAFRCHAAVDKGRRTLVSHETAALLDDLPLFLPGDLRPDFERVVLTMPVPPGSRPRVGTRVFVADMPENHQQTVRGLTLTTPLRTAFDLARLHGETAGVVAADAALHRGCDIAELESMVSDLANWRGAASTRRLVDLVDAGSESPGETLTRLLVRSLDLGPMETQSLIRADGKEAEVDLRIGRLIIEFDGRSKYGDERRYGRSRDPSELLWSEKQREDWLRSLGFTVVRLTWADLMPRRREATARMLRERFALAHRAAA